jgi:uncharacterized protein YbjT (DUF2867 family)
MKLATCFLLFSSAQAFAPSLVGTVKSTSTTTSLFGVSSNDNNNHESVSVSRRGVFEKAAVLTGASLWVASSSAFPAFAEGDAAQSKSVVVAGATGQTGRRVLERLAATPGLKVVGAVRNTDKAAKALSESSTVIRGAMVQKVSSIDASSVDLKHLDVVKDSVDEMAALLQGSDSLIIALGFVPGNPLKMNSAAHEVDNVGTCRLVDAAKQAGVKKVVMVSSILTDGRSWGQEKAPGFIITNAFGQVLDEKIVAEKYLRASGLDYTIVRPGGLSSKAPVGALKISGENTLNAGEISRDLVADVCVAALSDPKVSKKVIEIVEDEGEAPKVFNGLIM